MLANNIIVALNLFFVFLDLPQEHATFKPTQLNFIEENRVLAYILRKQFEIRLPLRVWLFHFFENQSCDEAVSWFLKFFITFVVETFLAHQFAYFTRLCKLKGQDNLFWYHANQFTFLNVFRSNKRSVTFSEPSRLDVVNLSS